MRKKSFYSKLLNTLLIVAMLITTCPDFTVTARASYDPYEEAYNIHNAITYAVTYAEQDEAKNKEAQDCTYFVSKCLAAGGLPMDNDWNDNDTRSLTGYSDAYNTFVNVDKLRDYLFRKKQYAVQSFEYRFDGNLPSLPSPGDIIQFDTDSDGEGNHSVICTGYNSNNELMIASHTQNTLVSFDRFLSKLEYRGKITIYYIRMTDTSGLTDVTSRYIGKYVTIKSLEVNQYLSSNTDQDTASVDALANRQTASTYECFKVEAGDYGEVGFRSVSNGNYLTARIDIDSQFAPVRAAYGQNYTRPQSWESFRIYEKNGIQYIHSQANGKWVQVVADNADHPVKAASKMASTWERFQIEATDYPTNDHAGAESPSPGTTDSQLSNSSGSTVVSQYYWKTNYINGWYEGEWNNGHPNGWGKLTYDLSDNADHYTLDNNKALYYEGEFADGLRCGCGTVVYENGYKDEGTFYGCWQDGKVVFKGKRWLINDTYNGYWPITITASGTSTEYPPEYGNWCSVK